jgi:hypothetical protein
VVHIGNRNGNSELLLMVLVLTIVPYIGKYFVYDCIVVDNNSVWKGRKRNKGHNNDDVA